MLSGGDRKEELEDAGRLQAARCVYICFHVVWKLKGKMEGGS